MSAEHTPGPWEVVAINLDGWPLPTRAEYPNADVSFGIVKDAGAVITEGEIEANARLIAAAPDLLAALKDAVELIAQYSAYADRMKQIGRGFNAERYQGDLGNADKDMRAVIAKAEGQEAHR